MRVVRKTSSRAREMRTVSFLITYTSSLPANKIEHSKAAAGRSLAKVGCGSDRRATDMQLRIGIADLTNSAG